ncbi:MAG: Com family DNA-binding transcriptional regulator [Azoarcus sp.]|nr:Com family DNA-binding transcriptional regulator [Azoarcus sp.]
METVRCGQCARKLAEADYRCLAIKCPRCGTLNMLKAASRSSNACPRWRWSTPVTPRCVARSTPMSAPRHRICSTWPASPWCVASIRACLPSTARI